MIKLQNWKYKNFDKFCCHTLNLSNCEISVDIVEQENNEEKNNLDVHIRVDKDFNYLKEIWTTFELSFQFLIINISDYAPYIVNVGIVGNLPDSTE